MAPKQFKMGGGGKWGNKMKIKWKREGAVEEQPSCERKLGSHQCEFRRHN